ncbi:hypothetical protein PIB30_102398 [Stylosanthes scabra]|uniref:Uncharacterized protein n=1 Tax=Stylosanthes scabra TaxID=79078 RepID=A0ABU6RY57_9FABA|nr:hypothetical protein [Stylosanthes scabra]
MRIQKSFGGDRERELHRRTDTATPSRSSAVDAPSPSARAVTTDLLSLSPAAADVVFKGPPSKNRFPRLAPASQDLQPSCSAPSRRSPLVPSPKFLAPLVPTAWHLAAGLFFPASTPDSVCALARLLLYPPLLLRPSLEKRTRFQKVLVSRSLAAPPVLPTIVLNHRFLPLVLGAPRSSASSPAIVSHFMVTGSLFELFRFQWFLSSEFSDNLSLVLRIVPWLLVYDWGLSYLCILLPTPNL